MITYPCGYFFIPLSWRKESCFLICSSDVKWPRPDYIQTWPEPAQVPANFTFVELTAYNACGPFGPFCLIMSHPFFIHSNGSILSPFNNSTWDLCGLICWFDFDSSELNAAMPFFIHLSPSMLIHFVYSSRCGGKHNKNWVQDASDQLLLTLIYQKSYPRTFTFEPGLGLDCTWSSWQAGCSKKDKRNWCCQMLDL